MKNSKISQIPPLVIQTINSILAPYNETLEGLIDHQDTRNNPSDENPYLTYKQAAKLLLKSTETIKRLADAGKIKRIKLG